MCLQKCANCASKLDSNVNVLISFTINFIPFLVASNTCDRVMINTRLFQAQCEIYSQCHFRDNSRTSMEFAHQSAHPVLCTFKLSKIEEREEKNLIKL